MHKKVFVSMAIIRYALSIIEKAPKLENHTPT